MTDMNNPWWYFESTRRFLRPHRGPTIGLVIVGIGLVVIGLYGAPALVVLGVVAILVGAWPIVQRYRD